MEMKLITRREGIEGILKACVAPLIIARTMREALVLGQTPLSNSATDDSAHSNVGSSGPNAWFDVQAQPGDGNDLGETNAAYAWTNITLTQGGTATKLRVYIGTNFGSFDCKMALYDNSGNLLSSGGPVTFSANGYLEVPITNVSVSATTYRIAWEMSNSNAGVARLSSGGGGSKSYCAVTLAYASFPDNPNGTCVGPFTANYCVGIFVQ